MLWSLQLRMQDRTKASITYRWWQEWWSAHNIGVTSPKVEGLENSIVDTWYRVYLPEGRRDEDPRSTLNPVLEMLGSYRVCNAFAPSGID